MGTFSNARSTVTQQIDRAENILEGALDDLDSILSRYETTLERYNNDEPHDETRYDEAIDKIARLYSDTADSMESELEEVGLSFSDVESDVDDAFEDRIRAAGFDATADETSFSQYY